MKPMMNNNDILLMYIQYDDPRRGKPRPALVIKRKGETLSMLMITSKPGNSEAVRHSRYKIKHWKEAGLTKHSYIRVDRVYEVLMFGLTYRFLGRLTKEDAMQLSAFRNTYKQYI